MAVAALIAWLVTAAGGFWMLGIWISRGGMRGRGAGASRFPAPVILGHFLLPAWRASRVLATAGGPGAAGLADGDLAGGDPAERHLPVPVIIGHGVLAVVTLLLAALTAAGVS